jgi:hypothetical protein
MTSFGLLHTLPTVFLRVKKIQRFRQENFSQLIPASSAGTFSENIGFLSNSLKLNF